MRGESSLAQQSESDLCRVSSHQAPAVSGSRRMEAYASQVKQDAALEMLSRFATEQNVHEQHPL